ncbi:hypothetical protein AHF37_04966 [Paragonimus kellicotti]|nr:hypothetical protein AHF37_04966 [Paragonimus kellicotti]
MTHSCYITLSRCPFFSNVFVVLVTYSDLVLTQIEFA